MKILYLGNKNNKNQNNPTGLDTLKNQLKEFLDVESRSNKKNRILRLIDMVVSIIINRKSVEYILIDTYSTKGFYFAIICSFFCFIFNKKYILILRGGNLEYRLKQNKILSTILFKNSHINISPSLFMQSIFKNYGFETKYVPNNIIISKYKHKPRLKLSNPKILWVRSFHEIYNPLMAINVFYRVLKTYNQARLCMVGPKKDNSFEKCIQLVEELNIKDKVVFTGQLDKKDWISLSKDYNIFINTTNFDNLPVSVIEAMALGLPVVSTNAGGLKYLHENDSDALLVDRNDISKMAEKIISIIEDPSLSKKLSINGLKKAKKFDWEYSKDLWKSLFFKV